MSNGDEYYWMDGRGNIRVSPRLPSREDDQIRGECSGIPQCCINFFTTVWATKENPFVELLEHASNIDKAKKHPLDIQYVPCPECLATSNFIKIKWCTKESCFCGQWVESKIIQGCRESKLQKRKIRQARKKRRGYA